MSLRIGNIAVFGLPPTDRHKKKGRPLPPRNNHLFHKKMSNNKKLNLILTKNHSKIRILTSIINSESDVTSHSIRLTSFWLSYE